MRIDELFGGSRPVFSFEFFPPKTAAGVEGLFSTIAALRELEPSFVSVTYGAGGSTRTRTVDLVTRIKHDLVIEPLAHFTCAGSSRDDLHAVLRTMRDAGVQNVLALRGDPPQGEGDFVPADDGLSHGSELAAMIRTEYDFCIAGACYPEGHPESADAESEMRHTVAKVEAGTNFLITQLFFDNDLYFDFVRCARQAGITVPIIPGIMPITNVEQITRFTSRIGASIPEPLIRALADREDDAEAVVQLGVAWSTLQCAELLARGAPGIHFYTLNRSPSTRAIMSALLAAQPWHRRAG